MDIDVRLAWNTQECGIKAFEKVSMRLMLISLQVEINFFSYLLEEALNKKGVQCNEKLIRGCNPKVGSDSMRWSRIACIPSPNKLYQVPKQPNHCDCGVYLLKFVEKFFEDPETNFVTLSV